jgi:hypothetical protein
MSRRDRPDEIGVEPIRHARQYISNAGSSFQLGHVVSQTRVMRPSLNAAISTTSMRVGLATNSSKFCVTPFENITNDGL